MTTLFVLDVDDFRPLAQVAALADDVAVTRLGPYLQVTSERAIHIRRNSTGCRNAVWYSSIAAISGGRVTRWDREMLTIEPASSGSAASQAGSSHAG
jgi:hypothetical protein